AEFHNGGTNARGFIIAGNLGIARDTFLGLRWLSADTVSGPQYRTDSLYFELQSNF
ncbi:putative porin, partial [Stenotrophomonas sp. A3_2]|uniref:putative porin n=1 Tax=Stenotrophomonas sp. A3_2 TaxID=3119978 RepID=UPI00387E3D22